MPDLETLTDAELEELRRTVLDEQEARFVRRREEARERADAANARVDLAREIHRFLEAGGDEEQLLTLSASVVNEHKNQGGGGRPAAPDTGTRRPNA